MAAPPDLQIPPSNSHVQVSIIDTTSKIAGFPMSILVYPEIKGHDMLVCPSYAFYIKHPSGRSILFDFGIRKDWQNLVPRIAQNVAEWKVSVEKDGKEILEEHSIDTDRIEALIWSHQHWDHLGDPSRLDRATKLIVGPGFKDAFLPGYPTNPSSPILETDYAGREVAEVSFAEDGPRIGNFPAHDYFGDGSFYILDAPGHSIGHLCALARLEDNSYIFMGGDSCHHSGEFRPSPYLPFPTEISPHPLSHTGSSSCPGAMFEHLLHHGDRTKAIYGLRRPDGTAPGAHDADLAEQTISKVQEVDVDERILVVMAHDETLLDVVDFFPKSVEGFVEKGWVKKSRWAFLRDFKATLNDSP
ncbi:metallo-beta-lactamase superfamily protein [Phlyctema vagabunda]|uniref:Metallo-beta-lactamase superfamily protein n=1 Tax=Phlyctema vagabunda TaxID=108571 RepID=A0ABR4PAX5_9HELO